MASLSFLNFKQSVVVGKLCFFRLAQLVWGWKNFHWFGGTSLQGASFLWTQAHTALFRSDQNWTCGQPGHQTEPTNLISTISSPSQSASMHNTLMTTIFTSPPFLPQLYFMPALMFVRERSYSPSVSSHLPSDLLISSWYLLSPYSLYFTCLSTQTISHFHPSPWHSSCIVPVFYYLDFSYLAPWCVVQSSKGANGITE